MCNFHIKRGQEIGKTDTTILVDLKLIARVFLNSPSFFIIQLSTVCKEMESDTPLLPVPSENLTANINPIAGFADLTNNYLSDPKIIPDLFLD
jgi:hypothetical protein